MLYFNERALEDGDFAINFAMLFTSHHFDGLREHLQASDGNSIFRAHILNMLQQNYSSKLYILWNHFNYSEEFQGIKLSFIILFFSLLFTFVQMLKNLSRRM